MPSRDSVRGRQGITTVYLTVLSKRGLVHGFRVRIGIPDVSTKRGGVAGF